MEGGAGLGETGNSPGTNSTAHSCSLANGESSQVAGCMADELRGVAQTSNRNFRLNKGMK